MADISCSLYYKEHNDFKQEQYGNEKTRRKETGDGS